MKRMGSMVMGCALLGLAAGSARADVQREQIINEIKAAFDTWSQVPCTNLKFEYKGELTEYVTEKQGALLVYFGYSPSTWGHSLNVFQTDCRPLDETTGVVVRGVIGLNAYNYDWTIGKEKNKIDIRTSVTRLIPFAIGYYVGPDPLGKNPSGVISFDMVDHSVMPLEVIGAQFDYFSSTAGTCVQPATPPYCTIGSWTLDAGPAPVDMGPASDGAGPKPDAGSTLHLCIYPSMPNDPSAGKPLHWETMPIPYYVYIPSQGRLPGGTPFVATDAGTTPPNKVDAGTGGGGDKNDDGCCRVSHAGSRGGRAGALLLLGLVGLLLAVRRRRRR